MPLLNLGSYTLAMVLVGKAYAESNVSFLFITPLKVFPLRGRSVLEICLLHLSGPAGVCWMPGGKPQAVIAPHPAIAGVPGASQVCSHPCVF